MMRRPEFYLGKPVFSLQTMLRQISFTDRRVLPVIPDGTYGRNTYASVRSFQTVSGLPQTGSVDMETWNAIAAAYHESLRLTYLPLIAPLWPLKQTVQPGECNDHVCLVQGMLCVLARRFSALTAPDLTGCLDAVTADGLRWVQQAAGLSPTGALDAVTWQYLNGLYRTVAGDGDAVQA